MLWFAVLVALLLAGQAPTPPVNTSAASTTLDYDVYRTRIEPMFLKPRAADEGSGHSCFECHTTMATRMRLQPLSPGATEWTPEQSRQNFAAVSRLVTPGDPMKSRLLLHPLAPSAGGDPTHTGGKFWESPDNPEWQMVAAWIKAAVPVASAATSAAPTLDYEFFKARVQPIFMATRGEHARCTSCHIPAAGAFRLQPLSAGATSWNEEQTRRNFQSASQLVAPGDPLSSRLLMHPLGATAGGDPFHTGGKQWTSKDDPEWQVLLAWVTGKTSTNQ
jgi:hypothetical protein